MSTPTENTNVSENPIFDPFPEPSGYPSGWDISELTPAPAPAPVTSMVDDAEA